MAEGDDSWEYEKWKTAIYTQCMCAYKANYIVKHMHQYI